MRRLQFWFEFASTYSYVAALRLERVAGTAGVTVDWKPFLLGPIFRGQGWSDSPFNVYPVKGRYMWRDMERLCAAEGLPLKRPSQFPRNGLLAARVATLQEASPWRAEFARRIYTANFADDQDIGDPVVVGGVLGSLGLAAAEILESAHGRENKERLRLQTEEAVRLGIFGAPSFVIGAELFWGNDRLEQAVAWCAKP
jgi:2-hydroxychromene-2-carboxylate isomerase